MWAAHHFDELIIRQRLLQLGRFIPRRAHHVAGVVLVRQMPGSAKGIMFITLEDESDIAISSSG